jgi:hypothetical protein
MPLSRLRLFSCLDKYCHKVYISNIIHIFDILQLKNRRPGDPVLINETLGFNLLCPISLKKIVWYILEADSI